VDLLLKPSVPPHAVDPLDPTRTSGLHRPRWCAARADHPRLVGPSRTSLLWRRPWRAARTDQQRLAGPSRTSLLRRRPWRAARTDHADAIRAGFETEPPGVDPTTKRCGGRAVPDRPQARLSPLRPGAALRSPPFGRRPPVGPWLGGVHYRTLGLRGRPSPAWGHARFRRDRHSRVPTRLSGGPVPTSTVLDGRPVRSAEHAPGEVVHRLNIDLTAPGPPSINREVYAVPVDNFPPFPTARTAPGPGGTRTRTRSERAPQGRGTGGAARVISRGNSGRADRHHRTSRGHPAATVSSATGVPPSRERPHTQPQGPVVNPPSHADQARAGADAGAHTRIPDGDG
jgi:hypothetical protein